MNFNCSGKYMIQSYNYPDLFIIPWEKQTKIMKIENSEFTKLALFKIVPGLANPLCVSIESVYFPKCFLRHRN